MSVTWYHYKVYCNTEGLWSEKYGPATELTCGNNNAHSVNPDSLIIIDELSNAIVAIKEEETPPGMPPTSNKFETASVALNIAANSSASIEWRHKFPIVSLKLYTLTEEQHRGGLVTVTISENTVIGMTTAACVSTDTTLHVSSTVLNYLLRGYWINLFDGVTQLFADNRVVQIDKNASTITLDQPVGLDLPSGLLVRMTAYTMKDFEFYVPGRYEIGAKHVGGAYIPANTLIKLKYQNPQNIPVKFVGYMERYY